MTNTNYITADEAITFLRDCVRMAYMPRSFAAHVARGLASGDIPRTWADLSDHLDEYPSAAEYALGNA